MATSSRAPKKTASPIVDEELPGMKDLTPDPEPGKRPPGRPRGSKTIKKAAPKATDSREKSQLKAAVATELYGFASLFVGIWGLKDECAEVFTETVRLPGGGTQERLEAIIERTVEILGRNDKVLSALATGGMIGEIGMLAHLLMPVVKQVWTAHGPGGTGHRAEGPVDIDEYSRRYPAPALA